MRNHFVGIGLKSILLVGMILTGCSKEADEATTDLSVQDPADEIYSTVEQMPKQINTVRTEYPPAALKEEWEGIVHVKMLLRADGIVEKAELFRGSGFASLDSTAVEAAGRCLFSPGLVDDKPVRMWLYKSYSFNLDLVKEVISDGNQRHLIDF